MRGSEPVTEQREALHADIDLLSTIELVELVNDEDSRVAPVMLVVSVLFALIVVVILLTDLDGPFIGPWG